MNSKVNMEYRFLGQTGLKVSALGFGNYLTSDVEEHQARTEEMIKKCYELGINFFDTAEYYGMGKGEVAMGKAFKNLNIPREQIVVSTKIYFGGEGPNDKGLCRKHVIEGTLNSLKRLQLDYADIVFAHRPDYTTPLEETCRAFDYLINTGKIFYWGTSEWPADRIAAAYAVCDKLGLHRPVAEQPEYSMLVRDKFEKEYSLLFRDHGMGSTIFCPLAGGILTGKYNEGVPEGTRFHNVTDPMIKGWFDHYFSDSKKEGTVTTLKAIGDIANELGCTQAQLALAWTLANSNVSVALVGATKIAQIEDNIKALEVRKKLTPEILEKIDKALKNKPEAHFDFRNKTSLQKTR